MYFVWHIEEVRWIVYFIYVRFFIYYEYFKMKWYYQLYLYGNPDYLTFFKERWKTWDELFSYGINIPTIVVPYQKTVSNSCMRVCVSEIRVIFMYACLRIRNACHIHVCVSAYQKCVSYSCMRVTDAYVNTLENIPSVATDLKEKVQGIHKPIRETYVSTW